MKRETPSPIPTGPRPCRKCHGKDFTLVPGHNAHGERRLYFACVPCARRRNRERMRRFRAERPWYAAVEAQRVKAWRARRIG